MQLFLGTKKYQQEESYSQFLAEKGGDSNAFTAEENTNYQFQLVVPKSAQSIDASDDPSTYESPLYEALDRFSQFFIAPLFTESATERELNAVDSEHQKNVQNDGNRIFQLGQSRANVEHPYSKFGTGSKATLWDEPQKQGIDTRARLLEMYEKWYSANLMTLCVSSPHSLDVMQKWVIELFTPIKNKDVPLPSSAYREIPALTPENMHRTLYVVPIKDIRLLNMSWLIPGTKGAYRSKPCSYISHLLGHESKGSLLSLLKDRSWVDGLSAGQSVSVQDFGMFDVSVELTKDGVDHVDEIVEMVFGYIRLVRERGVQAWIHDESAALADMSFRFAERQEPFSYVQRLSTQMSAYPEKDYLSGAYRIEEYDPDWVRTILDCLTPERVNVLVAGSFVAGTTDCTEKWYGTAYRVEDVVEEKLEQWRSAAPAQGLDLPCKNPFIPKDFALVAEPLPDGDVDTTGPVKLVDDDFMELYYKLDRTFGRPKANVRMLFVTPVAYASPRNFVLCSLYTSLLHDELNEFSYDADLAGLRYELRTVDHGMQLAVAGYNDGLHVFTSAILKKMASFKARKERFVVIYDQWERHWANWDKDQPYQHAMYDLSHMLVTPKWHVNDFLKCLRGEGGITVEAVNDFVPQLLSRMRTITLVHGNVTEEWARNMCAGVKDELKYNPLPRVERPSRRVVSVPTDCQIVIRKDGSNKEDNNSAVHMSLQVGPRGIYRTDVLLELVAEILNKPAFHELRTKQQLGYMVFSGVDACENVRGLYFIIQSPIADPDELCRRIEAFLVRFRVGTLSEMTDPEFDGFVDSMIALKMENDKAMAQRSRRFFAEIVGQTYVFDRFANEIAALRNVRKSDVVSFFDSVIAAGGMERRKVCSLVYGSEHRMQASDIAKSDREAATCGGNVPVKVVVDPLSFRLSRPLYPAPGCFSPYSVKS